MLLIHAGHGWLLEQFLSPATNARNDDYGGSLENRARLALEVISAVRRAVGSDFPIELRISAQEYIGGGYPLSDIISFSKLAEDKIDLLHVSTGSHANSFYKTHLSMFDERGLNVRYAEEIKKHVKIPVAAIGGLNEPQMLDEIIASGSADAVVMGRALLADPYLPRKAMTDRDDEIVRCCRCFLCMAERLITGLRVCALNPVIGAEYEHNFMPPLTAPKKVLIAGGGPGGMQCAITAAQRGHEVILCEKSDSLGGALKAERGVPFKSDLYGFIATKALQMEKAGVDIRLDTEVTKELAAQIAPDALIIAVGAQPFFPAIPGITRAVPADDLPDCTHKVGQKVVIIGGGLVGCETALHLAHTGRDVTVVEMGGVICPDANPRHRPILVAELEKSVTCFTDTCVTEVTGEDVLCETAAGKKQTPADTVILAAGRRANTETVDSLRDAAPYVETIGDCVTPGNVANAVFRGHYAALGV
jgi:NADPH-dependent 2,4-dienoyl-CoA reductase/sulfur reductase-like enzyme